MSSSTRRSQSTSPVKNHRSVGRDYESLAASFYQCQGFTILERSWQAGHKEIDLIARTEALLVFVEVKAARSGAFGHPAEWVSAAKRRNLITAAQQYLADYSIRGCDIRFDVVCFVNGALEHFPGAFSADEDSDKE